MMFRIASILAPVACVVAQVIPLVKTPANVVQCQPTLITWAAAAPVFVSIIPGEQPDATVIRYFGQQTGSFTWVVDLPAGTSIIFQVLDSAGSGSQSAPATIIESNDASCLGASSTVASVWWVASLTAPAIPSTTAPANDAVAPNAKVGLARLLGLAAAAVVM